MAVKLRPATAGEVAAIQEIGRSIWPATYAFAGDEYVTNGLATWRSSKALLRSPDDTVVLLPSTAAS